MIDRKQLTFSEDAKLQQHAIIVADPRIDHDQLEKPVEPMRSYRSILLVMIFVTCVLHAQDPSSPRYRITTVPTQFLFMEFPIQIERNIGRQTFGITGAFRPDLIGSGEIPGRGAYHLQNYWNFANRSATGGIMHKYYLRDRMGLHVETSMLYRVWWFNEKTITYSGDESFSGIRSEQQEIFLLKLVIGKSIMWHRKKGPAHVLEFFAGPSIRFKRIDLTTHEGIIYTMEVEDLRQQDEFWLPALQVGLRYGIGLRR